MSGYYYQVDPNAAFIEIVVQDTADYISPNSNAIPVVPHSTQSWPVHPSHGALTKTTQKYAASWTITHNYYEATRVQIAVGDVELVYQMEDDGHHYRLLHIAQGNTSLSVSPAPHVEDHSRLANELIHAMPGLDEEVASPCTCTAWHVGGNTVQAVIIHLNDRHHPTKGSLKADPWSRERIAQWTETLPFDLTLDPGRKTESPSPGIVSAWGKQVTLSKKVSNAYWDETHSKEYQKHIKSMMDGMVVSKDSFLKSVGLVAEAAGKTTEALEDLSGAMKKSFEVEFTNVDPDLYEMLTGMPYPGDEKEEA
jgi:hypothetical protein